LLAETTGKMPVSPQVRSELVSDDDYSKRRAFTGSRRAAKYAGMSAAREQIKNALKQMSVTSRGITSAGIDENW
jgi:hypothetical protein